MGGEEGPEFRPAAAGITDIVGEEITSLCTAGRANPISLSGGKYHSAKIFMERNEAMVFPARTTVTNSFWKPVVDRG